MRSEEMICRALDIDLRDYWTLLGAQSCDTLDNQVTHTSLKKPSCEFSNKGSFTLTLSRL